MLELFDLFLLDPLRLDCLLFCPPFEFLIAAPFIGAGTEACLALLVLGEWLEEFFDFSWLVESLGEIVFVVDSLMVGSTVMSTVVVSVSSVVDDLSEVLDPLPPDSPPEPEDLSENLPDEPLEPEPLPPDSPPDPEDLSENLPDEPLEPEPLPPDSPPDPEDLSESLPDEPLEPELLPPDSPPEPVILLSLEKDLSDENCDELVSKSPPLLALFTHGSSLSPVAEGGVVVVLVVVVD